MAKNWVEELFTEEAIRALDAACRYIREENRRDAMRRRMRENRPPVTLSPVMYDVKRTRVCMY